MRKLVYFLFFITAIIIVFLCYCFCNKNIPQKNFRNFSTNRYFVYTDVEYKNTRRKIVVENNTLFSILNEQKRLNEFGYIIKMNFNICNNRALMLTDNSYQRLKGCVVSDSEIADCIRLESINSIINQQYLDPKLDSKRRNAIIYILLNKKIKNCYTDCESGLIILNEP